MLEYRTESHNIKQQNLKRHRNRNLHQFPYRTDSQYNVLRPGLCHQQRRHSLRKSGFFHNPAGSFGSHRYHQCCNFRHTDSSLIRRQCHISRGIDCNCKGCLLEYRTESHNIKQQNLKRHRNRNLHQFPYRTDSQYNVLRPGLCHQQRRHSLRKSGFFHNPAGSFGSHRYHQCCNFRHTDSSLIRRQCHISRGIDCNCKGCLLEYRTESHNIKQQNLKRHRNRNLHQFPYRTDSQYNVLRPGLCHQQRRHSLRKSGFFYHIG